MNGEAVTPEERDKICRLRESGMSVNMIAYVTGRSGRTVRRVSDCVAPPVDRVWSRDSDTYRFLQKWWDWDVPKKKSPKKKPARRGLTTPYYYPRMWAQLPEEERPYWYHED